MMQSPSIKLLKKSTLKHTQAKDSPLNKQQSEVLLAAIARYLSMKRAQGLSRERGSCFNVPPLPYLSFPYWGLSSFASPASESDISRARFLESLLSAIPAYPIAVLQRHLRAYSRIDENDLDRYLLEAVFAHKHLFLQWFPNYNRMMNLKTLSPSSRQELYEIILNDLIYPSKAQALGERYESENTIGDRLAFASYYYAWRLCNAKPEQREPSFHALQRLANNQCKEAQFLLGHEFYHGQRDFHHAIHWCMQAAEQQHPGALAYLEGEFPAPQYVCMARKYEQGQCVSKNLEKAKHYYEKACQVDAALAFEALLAFKEEDLELPLAVMAKHNPRLVFQLGDEYEHAPRLERDLEKACRCYALALDFDKTDPLFALHRLADEKKLPAAQFVLAGNQITKGDYVAGIASLIALADKGLPDAQGELNALAEHKAEHAYEMGRQYEEVMQGPLEPRACVAYLKAMQNENSNACQTLAKARFEAMLNAAEASAERLIAVGEICAKGSMGIKPFPEMATNCFEKAAQKGSALALYYLGEQAQYLEKNFLKAAAFYQRAKDQGLVLANGKVEAFLSSPEISAVALSAIGALYHKGQGSIKTNLHLGLQFYQRACEAEDPKACLYLGAFYQVSHGALKKDKSLAFHYYLQAAKLKQKEALAPLARLAEHESPENQKALADIYTHIFKDPMSAQKWQQKASALLNVQFKDLSASRLLMFDARQSEAKQESREALFQPQ